EVVHGEIACNVSLNDLADRPPRILADEETLDLGGKRARFLYTPHVPHGWEACVFMEETTRTLLCGDLMTNAGAGPAITESDLVGPAVELEGTFHAMSMAPNTEAVLERLAALAPTTLAIMHGSSFMGDGGKALAELAAALAATE
ncbi:MAG: MBL fold metallo-hydrolase, partial [Caulobacteraceae bacterium]